MELTYKIFSSSDTARRRTTSVVVRCRRSTDDIGRRRCDWTHCLGDAVHIPDDNVRCHSVTVVDVLRINLLQTDRISASVSALRRRMWLYWQFRPTFSFGRKSNCNIWPTFGFGRKCVLLTGGYRKPDRSTAVACMLTAEYCKCCLDAIKESADLNTVPRKILTSTTIKTQGSQANDGTPTLS